VDRQIDFISHLAAALGVDKEDKPMGQLDQFAEDVNETLAALNKAFEDLNARKEKLKASGAKIAGKWADHFTAQEASIKAAEAALNRISNVPVSGEKKDG
jgi:hypothetical protein